MKKHLCTTFAYLALLSLSAHAASGPNDRQATSPKSVTSQPNPDARAVPIDDLYYSRQVNGPSWSNDGKQIVFTTNFTGRFNLWKVDANGGWPIQLLQSDDRQFGAIWSPDDKTIVYIQDVGGHEIFDIWAVPSNGGQPVNLTNTPHISEAGALFSHDGAMLAIPSKPETSPIYDVVVFDLHTHQTRNLTNEKAQDHLWQPVAWSKDDKYIYAVRTNAGFTDADVYRIEVSSARPENLTPHTGEIVYSASSVAPDGRVLLTSNEKAGYQNVAILDPATKKLTFITETQWEAGAGNFSPDGRYFTYTLNVDGRISLYLQESGHSQAQKLPFPEGLTFDAGTPTSFSPDGTRLLVSHEGSQNPADLWIYDFITPDKIAVYQVNTSGQQRLEARNSAGGGGEFFLQIAVLDTRDAHVIKKMQLPANAALSSVIPTHDGKFIVRTGNIFRLFSSTFEQLALHDLPLTSETPYEDWQITPSPAGDEIALVHRQIFQSDSGKETDAKAEVEIMNADTLELKAKFQVQHLARWSAAEGFLVATNPGKSVHGDFGILDFNGTWKKIQTSLQGTDLSGCSYDMKVVANDRLIVFGCNGLFLLSVDGKGIFSHTVMAQTQFSSVVSSGDYLAVESLHVGEQKPGEAWISRARWPHPLSIDVYDLQRLNNPELKDRGEIFYASVSTPKTPYYDVSARGDLAVIQGEELRFYNNPLRH